MNRRLQIAAAATVIGVLALTLAPQLEEELGALWPRADPSPKNSVAAVTQPAVCNEDTLATRENALESLKIAGINPAPGEFIKQAEKGHLCVVRLMLKSGVPMIDYDGFTPLMAAADHAQDDIGILLLQQGADPNVVTRTKVSPGLTALIIAAERGRTELASQLIAHGANVNLAITGGKQAGETALLASLLRRHPRITTLLLNNGADAKPTFTAGEYAGMNALACALSWAGIETVQTLLEHGAEANAPLPDGSWQGHTPLIMAMLDETDHPDMARLLLAHGADPEAEIPSGEFAGLTARRIAANNHHQASLRVFDEWKSRHAAPPSRKTTGQ